MLYRDVTGRGLVLQHPLQFLPLAAPFRLSAAFDYVLSQSRVHLLQLAAGPQHRLLKWDDPLAAPEAPKRHLDEIVVRLDSSPEVRR